MLLKHWLEKSTFGNQPYATVLWENPTQLCAG